MKRSRPKQHTRKLKSGKKVTINKGVKKKKKRSMPVYIYRESTGGKHLGNEIDPKVRSMRNLEPINFGDGYPDDEMSYAFEEITNDYGDIDEVRVTNPEDDVIEFQWKRDQGTTWPNKEAMFPTSRDKTLSSDKLRQVKKLRDDQ